jgi:hypothetical protein
MAEVSVTRARHAVPLRENPKTTREGKRIRDALRLSIVDS